MTTNPSRVSLAQVFRRRGRHLVLDGIDLDVRAGEVVGVVGANGSGKTTLLRVLVGLTRPSSGSVVRAPGVTAHVPEVFACPERLSARSYLRRLGRIRGLSTAAADSRGGELLERLALAGGVDTAMGRLSKGNVQKVVIAQALMLVPDLLVLDEPWSGLDPAAHRQLAEMLREVADAGGAVVLADHDHAAVNGVAGRVFDIVAGRLVDTGSVPAVRDLMTVELLAPHGHGGAAPPWTGLVGVQRERRTGRIHTVQVGRGDHDLLLQLAVTHRWSINAVGPLAERPTGEDDGASR